MFSDLKKRIRRAKKSSLPWSELEQIATLIARGAFYDELDETQKELYCRYMGVERTAFEDVNAAFEDGLHFKIERRPEPLSDAEFRQRVEEIEQFALGEEQIKEE